MSKTKRAICFVLSSVLMITFVFSIAVFAAEPVEISTFEQLLLVNEVPDGDYKLVSDIDLSEKVFSGPLIKNFSGTFDGNGYAITGLNVQSGNQSALIGTLTGTVTGLTVKGNISINSESETPVYAGAVAAINGGSVMKSYCDVTVDVTSSGTVYAGAVTGSNDYNGSTGNVEYCTATGSVTVAGGKVIYAAGISGAYGNMRFCDNRCAVTAESETADITYTAGISAFEANCEKCVNSARIMSSSTFQAFAGGISAFIGAIQTKTIAFCENSAAVIAAVGGSSSVADPGQAMAAAGGIVGNMANTAPVLETVDETACTSVVHDAANTGSITAYGYNGAAANYAGGIAGVVNGLVYNSFNNNGDEFSADYFGPVFGAVNPSGKLRGKIRNSYFADNSAEYNVMNGNESTVAQTVAVSAENLNDPLVYDGFDFESVWVLTEDDSAPHIDLSGVHNYIYNNVDADCTNDAYTESKCDLCGIYEKVVHEGTALGHAWDEGTVTTAPTCSAEGVKTYTCQNNPAHTETEPIDIDPEAHVWGEYVYNNDATTEADGTETAKCQFCDATDTRTAEGTKITIVDSTTLFTDMESGRWYKEYVDYVATFKLMNGMTPTTFEPTTTLNRAMFVQILANMSGVDTSDNSVGTVFTDVPAGKWYTPAVKWAYDNGIVDGMTPTTFEPQTAIQRQQICVMVVRYAEKFGIELTADIEKKEFADDSNIQGYAKEAVYICQQAGIVDGKTETEFKPRDNATRAEIATIITRFHQNFVAGK